MPLPTDLDRKGPSRSGRRPRIGFRHMLAGACGLSVAAFAYGQIRIEDLNRRQDAEQDVVSGVYLPTDRALSRTTSRARERLADGEYHQALAFLHEILLREEDSFLERADGDRDQAGLKATARELIRQLPPEGHETYELLHGATARRELGAALEARDQSAVAAVVRHFFHTKAGQEAALVLAQMESDQGHYLSAAQLYHDLVATPRAAERFEPQLSVLAARNYLAAGQLEQASTALRSMIEKNPSATVKLFRSTTTVPAPGADLVEWLKQHVGEPLPKGRGETDWLSVRGEPGRNAESDGGRPHLRARWQARVVNDPGLEAYLVRQSESFAQRGVVAIPGARPIAVDDVVIMRTPKNVVAIDWHTGKRIWETRDDDELNADETPSGFPGQMDEEQLAAQNSQLDERVWDDALTMSLASDGQRVFVLRGVSASPRDEMMAFRVIGPGFRGITGEASAATNQLAAYELATQGKLVWEIDGARGVGPLAGAFFLGPPLAVDDTLFVMAEIRSAVYLLALDPATGSVRWRQQLVGLEQGISLDPARRLIGATPSYAGGILVCPTAAGAIVAVDVVRREFAWVYRYQRESQSLAEMRNVWQQRVQNPSMRVNDRWLENSAIIDEGRVFITPPESAELHCLDLHTGKLLWKHRQVDSLMMGCVDGGHLLLVNAESVQALRVTDGAPAWPHETASLPEETLPAGQGYLSEGIYYLPLTSGEIAAVEMADGRVTRYSAAEKDVALGNLICYRGSVLSQSPLLLDKFEQVEALEERAHAALSKNPYDATALREIAELQRAEGKRADAIESLKQAHKLEPDDPLTRGMLAELLLEALDEDYALFRDDIPLVAELIQDRAQQIELGRIEANSLELIGKRVAAWNAYLRLADLTAEDPRILRLDADHSARSDRWISGRLTHLWDESTREERQLFAAQLSSRREQSEASQTAADLQHYLSHFGDLPESDTVRRRLARFLADRGRAADAEIELLQLAAADDPEQRAEAKAMIHELAKHDQTRMRWPTGRVQAEVLQVATPTQDRRRRAIAERQSRFRQMRLEQDFLPGVSRIHWFVSMDCSELLGRDSLGQDVFRLPINQNSWARQYRDSNLVHGAILGHVTIIAIGGQLMAIDTRQGRAAFDAQVLWQASPASQHSLAPGSRRRSTWAQNRASRRPVYHARSDRKRMTGVVGAVLGSLGPVTPRGVAFQEQNELRCVDPLSGETLWTRTDLPAGCELFGDEELVFAADVSERRAYVVRMIDGSLLGTRALPQPEWLLTSGRNIAQLGARTRSGQRAQILTVTDIWSQETLFDAEYDAASCFSTFEPNAVAVYEPSGRFQLVDVATGQVKIDQQLEPVPSLNSIHTLLSGDTLYVAAGGQNPQQQQRNKAVGQFDFPLISGVLYAFDMESGEPLWPGPATLRHRGMVLSQPEEIPFLAFVDRRPPGDGSRGGALQSRILLVDKGTGQSVYRADGLPDTSDARFRIRGEQYTEPRLSVELGAATIQVTLTDDPKPPQPPANDDVEAAPQAMQRGLLGLGQRILRGAIENPKPQPARPPHEQAIAPLDDD